MLWGPPLFRNLPNLCQKRGQALAEGNIYFFAAGFVGFRDLRYANINADVPALIDTRYPIAQIVVRAVLQIRVRVDLRSESKRFRVLLQLFNAARGKKR